MIYAIVPVKSEEEKIKETLSMLLSTQCDRILVVLNGCRDNSLSLVEAFQSDRLELIYFNKALGVDIPRAIGAYAALQAKAEGIVFVDGDMNGPIAASIDSIIHSLKSGKIDMALTNCYPTENKKSTMARMLLSFRKQLNKELKIYKKIGYAIPSHGPHGLSKKLLEKIPLKELAIPPVTLALAVKHQCCVQVVTSILAEKLQSTTRDEFHAHQMAKTIIGDCIEALQVYTNQDRTRGYDGITFTGYHKNRRFDILNDFIAE